MTRRLIRARRWTPPARRDRGPTAPLRVLRRLPTGGHGPEDVVFDTAGQILTGTADGRILRIDPATGERTVLADTGGRPLGLHARADGGVLVCDHDRGLLLVRPDGAVDTLVDTVDGAPLTFASNVTQAADGTIWFTTSTTRWRLHDHLGDVFEHSGTGRLLRRDPDGAVTTLLTGLKFANGLVLAPDESHLLFAETTGYRIRRYQLTGPDAGRTDVLVDNLPGFPDNMSLGSDGLLWLGIAAPRDRLLDRLLPLPGFLRLLLWNLPAAVRPRPAVVAWVMAFTLDGRPVHDLRAADGSYGFVTSAAEHHRTIVAGSLTEDDVAVLAAP
ncbi:SMP-30/gluconolactonase/LRE family protein [Actinoplanes teichomyceticus]|uniref:Sugar lactone lactonase YvrE n=1 Tax=Actinoplanes teichomyceticus TaxID=1867 RepID=A0A561VM62_ACTTI|nr:SMP-30/gluconolactonase/LRE family protein [Actinoplanes teichomyceticus]TWG12673.1 sugar lactone lactonase YvrE [Actinoplanes teichomyceticus]GIF13406.1 strictosidine synthase family protein [Actinoplanes teichomyceticus]